MTRQIPSRRGQSLIRARARATRLPFLTLREQTHRGGLITPAGHLDYCADRYFLRSACRGTGRA